VKPTTQPSQQPEPLEIRVTNLERGMSDLRVAAEALLQTAQIHQLIFEPISAELEATRQRHLESDRRFEILLAELRQLKIDSDIRFYEFQRRLDQNQDRQDEG
jgi:hypothetical protein